MTKISQIIPQTLHCSWKMLQNEDASSLLLNRPARIDEELFKLAVNALKSEKLANFAVNDSTSSLIIKPIGPSHTTSN